MPDVDRDTDASETSTRDRRDEKDKTSKAKGSGKVKDLSHVPCKFFKVGSCTAGPSCPFSHHVSEPGHQKDVCTWYVKGNCKFGHKCALAHILPGQSMSMDRRNKKAAQIAAGGGGGGGGAGGGGGGQSNGQQKDRDAAGAKSDRGKSHKNGGPSRAGQAPVRSSSLLTGSTAPTRVLNTGARPPLPISKAVPVPAAPAPALHDADFATVDPATKGDDDNSSEAPPKAATASEVGTPGPGPAPDPSQGPTEANANVTANANDIASPAKSPFLPLSTPSQPRRFTGRHGTSPSVDFGPVGSPPQSSPSNPTRVNGFSPGISPRDPPPGPPLMSSSPFSAPGGQSLFMPYEQGSAADNFKAKSGLAASLGAARTFAMDPPPSQRSVSGPKAFVMDSVVLEDDDMEEYIPSSLTDLLTPGERNRRMSRTSSVNPVGVGAGLPSSIGRPALQDHHHRYSRSVPAPSLLSDIKSIWSESGRQETQLQHPPGPGTSPAGHGLAMGAPSSYKSNNGFFSGFSDEGPSPSLLSPSNASAAFLPGLHQHYLSRPTMSNLRGSAQSHYTQHHQQHTQSQQQHLSHAFADAKLSSFSSSPLAQQHAHHAHHSPLAATAHHGPGAGDTYSAAHSLHAQHPSGRPIPASTFLAPELPLSPSARALQAHAPGQSLPQGLAAGYSRIHVQPPPPNVPSPAAFSPGAIGSFGLGHAQTQQTPGQGVGQAQQQGYGGAAALDWLAGSPSKSALLPHADSHSGGGGGNGHNAAGGMRGVGFGAVDGAGADDVGGLPSMFSRLSYSAAAARVTPPPAASAAAGSPGANAGAGSTVPLSMSRRPSARGWSSHPLSSPLSGPVLTNDDDDLFSMDEEK